jgi:hypothetical protein
MVASFSVIQEKMKNRIRSAEIVDVCARYAIERGSLDDSYAHVEQTARRNYSGVVQPFTGVIHSFCHCLVPSHSADCCPARESVSVIKVRKLGE